MLVNPLVVNELRSLFKSGATPSALIRRIAERHACEPKLDVLVREYFREAFQVPMVRVSLEQVKQIVGGGSLPILNVTILHWMIQSRPEWDGLEFDGCWLDTTASVESDVATSTDPERIPELAGSWDRMDDEAKEFIRRTIVNSHSLHERLNCLAALAEQLQQQVNANLLPIAQGA